MSVRRRYDHGQQHFDAELDLERRILVVWLNRAVMHRTAIGAGGRPGSLPSWLPREVGDRLAGDLARLLAGELSPAPGVARTE